MLGYVSLPLGQVAQAAKQDIKQRGIVLNILANRRVSGLRKFFSITITAILAAWVAPSLAATSTLLPTADAYVKAGSKTVGTNFGTATSLIIGTSEGIVFWLRAAVTHMARGFAPCRLLAGLWPALVARFHAHRAAVTGQRPADSRHGAPPRAIQSH